MEHGGLVGDRYRVDGRIGEGTAAEVFRVTDLRLGLPRALKLARDERGASALDREIERLGRVSHPQVVRPLDQGRVPARWVVLELADCTLAERVDGQGPLPPLEAVHAVVQVLDGLQAVHDAGLVHRDVKPENVLCTGPVCQLADFGIAADVQAGDVLPAGSRPYLAPEALQGSTPAPAQDVYAVGALLYHLLTAGNPVDLHAVPPSSPRFAGIPAPLVAVLIRAVAERPGERFLCAEDFAAALLQQVDHLPREVGRVGTGTPVPPPSATATGAPPRDAVAALEVEALRSWKEEQALRRQRQVVRSTRWSMGVGLTLLGVLTALGARASMEHWTESRRARQLAAGAPLAGRWTGVVGERTVHLDLQDRRAALEGELTLVELGEPVGRFGVRGVAQGGVLSLKTDHGLSLVGRQVSARRIEGQLGSGGEAFLLVRSSR